MNKMQRSYHDSSILTTHTTPNKDKVAIDIKNGHNGDHQMQLSLDKESKPDGRLFPNLPLYCEGHPRPKFRGIAHLIGTILLPFGLWHLYLESNESRFAQIVSSLYILTNIICYGSSAMYHVSSNHFTPAHELQK